MAFSDPERNIEQFELSEGQHVADLGSGAGFYTIEAARIVGGDGRVYAVDVQKDLLDRLRNAAHREQVYNVEIVWGDLDKLGGTKLRDGSMDALIVANVLFQLEDHNTFATEAFRIVKPHGKVLVVEWMDSFGNMGPDKDKVVKQEEARKLFESHGFVHQKDISAGAHHYGFILKRE